MSTIISPGNSFDPGVATTRSILSSLGRRIDTAAAGKPIRGWQGLSRRVLPGDHRNKLTPSVIERLNALLAEPMRVYGYAP